MADVSSLRSRLKSRLAATRTDATPAPRRLDPEQRPEHPNLSCAQQRMWYLDQQGAAHAYNLTLAIRLRGRLDADALRSALFAILERHEILRISCAQREGEPVQLLHDANRFALRAVDLRGLDPPLREQQMQAIGAAEAQSPFALETDSLVRGQLLQLDDDDHVLLLTAHHVVFDGWSRSILMRELMLLYERSLRGDASPLPVLPLQYSDYALWQQAWLLSDEAREHIQYWQEQLSGAPVLLELPTDRPRPPVQSYRGDRVDFRIDADLTREIRKLARRHDATLFMILHAAFVVVLARLSGQDDVVIGTPVANRRWQEVEGLIGCFVNTLALRVPSLDGLTVGELIRQIKRTTLTAYRHQDLPIEKLIEAIRLPRTPSHAPLFQVLLALQNTPHSVLQLPGLDLDVREVSADTAVVDLTLLIEEVGGELLGTLNYATDLFDRATIERWSRHFNRVLAEFVRESEQRLDAVPMWSPTEACALVDSFDAALSPARGRMHELFEAHVERAPQAIAVSDEREQLTYAQLNVKANQLAHHLRNRGVREGAYIVLLMPRCIEMLVAQLAALKIGCVYAPVDPQAPPQRQRIILDECGATAIVTLGGSAPLDILWVDVRAAAPDILSCPTGNPVSSPGQSSVDNPPAHVLYTSGSTGTPKGVVVGQGSIIRLCVNNGCMQVDSSDCVAHCSNPSFDASTFEIWTGLLNGARVAIVPHDTVLDPAAFERMLVEHRVTIMLLTTALFHQCVLAFTTIVGALKYLLFGGEAADPAIVRRLLARGAPRHLLQAYGPTEATTFASWYEVTGVAERARSVPIGRPLAGSRLYVLDRDFQPVPFGVVGEIHIGGASLAHGYLGQARLTAVQFPPDPHSAEAGARMYRTGDRGRWLADGNLEFVGRNDQQLKIRGFRVEPGEIEAQLLGHGAVHEAAVTAMESVPGDRQLVGYVTIRSDAVAAGTTTEQLRAYLRAKLPAFMVPAAIVILARLPLTVSGKVDHRALPKPDWQSQNATPYAAPRTPLESTLCDIWQNVLGVERVGIADDFFLLGGHSLLAVRLLNAIHRQLGRTVSLRQFIEAPLVEQLALHLSDRGVDEERELEPETVVPDHANRHEPFPLTPVQLAYWIGRQGVVELGNVGTHAYAEIPVRNLEVSRFEAALNRMIARHAALRTVITADARQQALEAVPYYQVAHEDWQSLDAEQRQARLSALRAEMSHRVFDGGTWPLFDLRVTRSTPDEATIHCSVDALVLDASSTIVLANEIIEAYINPHAPLSPLQLSFRDYVLARERFTLGDRYQHARAYWLARVPEFPQRPDLPLAVEPTQIENPRFERRTCRLPAGQWRALAACARRHQVTSTVLILSCFTEVLSRWSQRSRFTLNLTLFNRIPFHPQVDAILGDFTTLILLALDYDDRSVAFADRLRANQRQLWSDLEHRYFDGIEMLQVLRQASGTTASFPVVLTSTLGLAQGTTLGNHLSRMAQSPGASVAENYSITQTSQVWLDVQVYEQAESLHCNWDSVSGLFPEGMVDAMFDGFTQLLSALATDEERWQRPAQLELPAAQRSLIDAANATSLSLPAGMLHTPLLQQFARQEDKVAVRTHSKALSYRELESRSRILAHELLQGGARPEQPIAVVMEKGWQQVVAVVGILRAGAAYLPIDAGLPPARVALLLEAGEISQIVTTAEFAPLCAARRAQSLSIEARMPACPPQFRREPPQIATPANLAYVIFTSGSTGVPKGVMIEHRAALNTVHDLNQRYRVTERDCVLGLSSLSFDLSVYDIFGVLGAGGTLVLPAPDETRDPARWLPYLVSPERDEVVTIWNTVPALMQMLLDSPATARVVLGLRLILLSGDWIPVELPGRIRAVVPAAELISLGGATEASIWSIAYPIEAVSPQWRSIPYGKALANQSFHVLQGDLSPAPVWVAADLYIGGIGLARGYWRDTEKTDGKFIRHPATGERLYHTGDRGRLLPDGNIEFLGRTDLQVKVGGHRIELGEIEAHLKTHPSVGDALVIAHAHRGANHLIAYVVMKTTGEALAPLVDFLRGKLPDYMIPEQVIGIAGLPLSANGKVDRKNLSLPDFEAQSAAHDEAPLGETETTLAAIWQALLQVPNVGRQDNFFRLGGHSLLAVQLSARIHDSFGVDTPLRVLFDAPVLQQMGEWIDAQRRAGSQLALPDGPRAQAPRVTARSAAVRDALPLSLAQQRLWFISQLQGGGRAYHICAAVRLLGALAPAALETALDGVVQRHEVLRTIFADGDGAPRQVIIERQPFALAKVDVTSQPASERESQLARLLAEEANVPFDLGVGPLIRGLLVRVAEREHVLSITLHHAISDAWSMGILIREVAELYAACKEDRQSSLPPLRLQYADYALWERDQLQGETVRRQLDYWKQHLADAPAFLELPTDRPRPAVHDWHGESIEIVLPDALSRDIKEWAQHHGATLFMALYAGFALLLSKLSGQKDVVIGVPVANRQQPELNELIGFFVNTLPVRIQLDPNESAAALLDRVKTTMLAAYRNQDVAFEQVVEAVQPPRSQRHNPLFQTMFILQNAPQSSLELADLTLEPRSISNDSAQFDLSVSLQETGERISGHCKYASGLIERATAQRWVDYFVTLLSGMVRDERRRLGSLVYLRHGEQDRIVREFNATHSAYPRDHCLHELFAAQVQKTPDAVAVVHGDQYLTYAALDGRANQLARLLIERGVRAGSLVGLCVERGVEMLIGILGTLKASGAYVPVDPAYPPERIEEIFADAGLRCVLTHQRLVARLPEAVEHVIALDSQWRSIAAQSSADIDVGVCTPRDLAYVIYTSGSTGRPKGVMVEHGNIVNYVCHAIRQFDVASGNGTLIASSISFDLVLTALYPPLLCGKTVTLCSAEEGMADLPERLEQSRDLTPLKLTPSHMSALQAALPHEEWSGRVKVLVLGGEPLSGSLVKHWQRLAPGTRIFNHYGPTEATVGCIVHEVTADESASVPIGRPIANTRIYILDQDLQPVGPGVTGEIHIGGAGVARGYLNRPELTAQRFIPDPFSDDPSARLYRTGDLARHRLNGDIEFLGRNDQQVKIRGHRIELGEIESQLRRHEQVTEAVVVSNAGAAGDVRLVAYVTTRGAEIPAAQALRAHLRRVLPPYMVPSVYVVLDLLPLTPNGKVDKHRLPTPGDSALSKKTYEAPDGEVEQTLALIWEELLSVEGVGRHDDFFELGGHSLTAAQLVARVRQRLDVELPVKEVFETAQLAALAETIVNLQLAEFDVDDLLEVVRHMQA